MYNELKDRLDGCFYSIFTPFTRNEEVDFDALKHYITYLYNGGARRFYAMAYNSRYSQMSDDEIRVLNEFCIRTIKTLDNENIAIVGDPIHCSTNTSGEFARHAKDCGADLISLIVREKYFCDEQILEHYNTIGVEIDFPILVHEMPFLSGFDGSQMHWPESLLSALKTIPHVVALKEDAKNYELTCAALQLEPDIRIIIAGRKSEFMKFRPHGARAYLNGISIIDARIGESFWHAYNYDEQSDLDYILREIEAPFFDRCAAKFGWHRSNKALLHAAGLMHRRERMPMPHLATSDFEIVRTVYSEVSRAIETFYSR